MKAALAFALFSALVGHTSGIPPPAWRRRSRRTYWHAFYRRAYLSFACVAGDLLVCTASAPFVHEPGWRSAQYLLRRHSAGIWRNGCSDALLRRQNRFCLRRQLSWRAAAVRQQGRGADGADDGAGASLDDLA